MFARRVRIEDLDELLWVVSPAAVFAAGPARLGQPEGSAPFVRFGVAVCSTLPPAAVEELCARLAAAAPRLRRGDRWTFDAFASFLRSGLPAPPGLVRDALCLLAAVHLDGPRTRGVLDPFAVQLVIAALGVASLGEIRTPR